VNHDTNPILSDSRKKDLVRLLLLLVLATLPRVWMLTHTAVPSRDTIVFARYAVTLGTPPIDHRNGDRRMDGVQEVVQRAEHPPGFPATALLVHKFLYGSGTPTPQSILFATQLASIVASLLLIIPLYFLGKELYGGYLSFFAVGIFSVLPVWVEVSANGISDPLALLFCVMAIRCLVDAFRGKWFSLVYSSILSGWFIGLGFLVRPDVAVLGLSLGLVVLGKLVISLRRLKTNRDWLKNLVCGLLLTSATLSIMLPYRSLIGRWTNKRTGDAVGDVLTGKEVEKNIHERPIPNVGFAPQELPLFASWRTIKDPSKSEAISWAVKNTSLEFLKGSFYLFPLFGFTGLLLLLRSRPSTEIVAPIPKGANSQLLAWMLATWAILHFGILLVVAFVAGYISERHTLPIVLVCMLFSGRGFWAYGAWLQRVFRVGTAFKWVTLASVIFLVVPFALSFKSLHKSRLGHKEAGLWLKKYQVPIYWIIDPYGWVSFYSGRTLDMPPMHDPTMGPMQYVVWEPNGKEPESITPLYEVGKFLLPRGKIIYSYPPDAPPDKVQVVIYECRTLTPEQWHELHEKLMKR